MRVEIREECLAAFADVGFNLMSPKEFFIDVIIPCLPAALNLRAAIGLVTSLHPSPSFHPFHQASFALATATPVACRLTMGPRRVARCHQGRWQPCR